MRIRRLKIFLGGVGCEPHGQRMGAVGGVGIMGGVGAMGCEPHGQEMGAVGMEDEKGIKSFVL